MNRLLKLWDELVRRGAASAAPRAFENCHPEGARPSLGEEARPKDLLFADGHNSRSLATRSLRKLSSRLLGMTIPEGRHNGTAEAVPSRNPFIRKPRSFALLVSVVLMSLLAVAQDPPLAKAPKGGAPAQKSPAPSTGPADPELQKIKTPPLPEFHPQIPKRIVLPNGMVLLLQEDHELPLIDGIMRVRGGSRLEPASKVGLVDIYGDVWRTGGTKDKTGDRVLLSSFL